LSVLSSASGDFAPDLYQGSAPGPHWGTSTDPLTRSSWTFKPAYATEQYWWIPSLTSVTQKEA